ncbi:hypothetical protein N7509_011455 [Penicillium cosmopolitanum]|uniref:Dynamin GTPase domain-containing protein n=1 Tax=Penicillium cosmopolitanum TaxID=1131564 RepID=A0A9W9VTJ2_9EURO|nr:uncharacterized protein N7509_011455 [Penicillium cosmopolitanum]KAJ5388914.1 hypothetical protein N7509_011455 [Penicillium cosmopolitanum]
MTLAKFKTEALQGLCTQEQLDLLDSIDTLRSQGISLNVSLPQIIVCGDELFGKSSVLETISVSLFPEAEQHSLGSFCGNGHINLRRKFSNYLLGVEVSGPDRPHLTIADLQGLFHSETRQQSAADVQLVQDVIQSYMKEPRGVILAVLSAKNDFANQIILRLARDSDPSGVRTLSVICKPDVLVPRSESEALLALLAKNQEVELCLVDSLRTCVSGLLLGQVASELPSFVGEINAKVRSCQVQLQKLGDPRATANEKRSYLLHVSQGFQSLNPLPEQPWTAFTTSLFPAT